MVLLINLLIFSDKIKLNILVFLIIFLLTGYQFFEFIICSLNLKSSFTAYLAFVDISFLPPLSFILVFSLLKIKNKALFLIFIPVLFFIIYYSAVIKEFAVVKCTVLYAVYNYPLGTLYGFFYYLPILASFIFLYINLKKAEDLIRRQLKILIIGYSFIVIPALASFLLFLLNLPGLVNAIESILCKFAFGYAVALSIFALNNKRVNE
jgi:hypothetical protein